MTPLQRVECHLEEARRELQWLVDHTLGQYERNHLVSLLVSVEHALVKVKYTVPVKPETKGMKE